jgi:phosphatidylglycerol---prolipoprotein diacylglyceryl transferase
VELAVIDPIAISIGPLRVHWYGLIFGLGIVAAFFWGYRESKRLGLDPEFMTEISTWVVPFGILGGRLYEVFVLQWSYFRHHPGEIFAVWQGGLAIHGGVLLATLVGMAVAYRRRQSILQWGDIIMPGVILAQAIGRWGNFVNQEAFGAPASDRVMNLFPGWIREQMQIDGLYRHPTFLYESVWNLLVFGVLVAFARRVNPPRGAVFFLYWILYNAGRFVIEGIREDSSFVFGGLRVAQLMSAGLALAGIAGLLWVWRTSRHRYQGA